ncbi:hypothetical protein MHK_004775 [Candidatus Magnetomorum sp. HK-1]|nr:hypothetical protein MHK_004775 [Candidatus Magnetomorum sp. HK-1]
MAKAFLTLEDGITLAQTDLSGFHLQYYDGDYLTAKGTHIILACSMSFSDKSSAVEFRPMQERINNLQKDKSCKVKLEYGSYKDKIWRTHSIDQIGLKSIRHFDAGDAEPFQLMLQFHRTISSQEINDNKTYIIEYSQDAENGDGDESDWSIIKIIDGSNTESKYKKITFIDFTQDVINQTSKPKLLVGFEPSNVNDFREAGKIPTVDDYSLEFQTKLGTNTNVFTIPKGCMISETNEIYGNMLTNWLDRQKIISKSQYSPGQLLCNNFAYMSDAKIQSFSNKVLEIYEIEHKNTNAFNTINPA